MMFVVWALQTVGWALENWSRRNTSLDRRLSQDKEGESLALVPGVTAGAGKTAAAKIKVLN